MMNPIKALLMSPFVEQEIVMILAQLRNDDLAILAELMQAGKVTPVIDRRYKLSEVQEAIRYSEEGHARGKIIISLE
jgi:NADPH:quinone reductase-like Zn-dependent oxidoreductase